MTLTPLETALEIIWFDIIDQLGKVCEDCSYGGLVKDDGNTPYLDCRAQTAWECPEVGSILRHAVDRWGD